MRSESRFKISWTKLLATKLYVDISIIEAPFFLEEIKKATFDLRANKAPSSNDFPIFFSSRNTRLQLVLT